MSARTDYLRELARRRRLELIQDMGGICTWPKGCSQDNPRRLEFHHTKPRDWEANRVNRWYRVTLYRRDWLSGKTCLLCKKHHNVTKRIQKGQGPRYDD